MLQALFAWSVSILLIAGSTQIDLPILAGIQFLVGAWFAVAGAIAGWQAVNK